MQLPFFKRCDIDKLRNIERLGKQCCLEDDRKDICKTIGNADEQMATENYAIEGKNEPLVVDSQDKLISEINRWVFLLQ